ncbi:hypothetical protein MNBD_UNCLBAC01-35 [hydrothermal vent metagenome]|uniref:Uncharacterized protein n=1 Tax=hydrothermal vent metagenome TaxID=652676 RepID=A0A3B1D3N7_9ZZZZ
MTDVCVETKKRTGILEFLQGADFQVEDLENQVYRVSRDEELPVFLKIDENEIYFEVDLGNVSSFADQGFYFQLLDLNTEILPVSFGINNTNKDDPRLVLVESRLTADLSDNELLGVFDALELAVDKAEVILSDKDL